MKSNQIREIIQEELIDEIGSLTKSLPFKGPEKKGDEIIYTFNSPTGLPYEVGFSQHSSDDNNFDREFGIADGVYRSFKQTYKNEVYSIMSTVTQITIDFINKFEPNSLFIYHINTSKEWEDIEVSNKPIETNKRAKLNKMFLEKNLPEGYRYILHGSTSIIRKISSE